MTSCGDVAPETLERRLEMAAIHGLVALLCNVRLALVLAAFLVAIDKGLGGSATLTAAALLPSWLPLRYWITRPRLYHASHRYLVLDALVTVLIVWVCAIGVQSWELAVAYLLMSAALWGVLAERTSAVLTATLAAVVSLPLLAVDGMAPVERLGTALGALGIAYATYDLARHLRHQGFLARRLMDARATAAMEEERAALAREMHDSLAKTLHGVTLLAATLESRLIRERSSTVGLAAQVRAACATANDEARSVVSGLRCPGEKSLAQILAVETRPFEERTGLPAAVRIEPAAAGVELRSGVVHHLRRILGELLENTDRHARASSVAVDLEVTDTDLVLAVEDDGIGMPPARSEALALAGHYGLVGVRERAEKLGARYEVTRGRSRRGTCTTITMPLAGNIAEGDGPRHALGVPRAGRPEAAGAGVENFDARASEDRPLFPTGRIGRRLRECGEQNR